MISWYSGPKLVVQVFDIVKTKSHVTLKLRTHKIIFKGLRSYIYVYNNSINHSKFYDQLTFLGGLRYQMKKSYSN